VSSWELWFIKQLEQELPEGKKKQKQTNKQTKEPKTKQTKKTPQPGLRCKMSGGKLTFSSFEAKDLAPNYVVIHKTGLLP